MHQARGTNSSTSSAKNWRGRVQEISTGPEGRAGPNCTALGVSCASKQTSLGQLGSHRRHCPPPPPPRPWRSRPSPAGRRSTGPGSTPCTRLEVKLKSELTTCAWVPFPQRSTTYFIFFCQNLSLLLSAPRCYLLQASTYVGVVPFCREEFYLVEVFTIVLLLPRYLATYYIVHTM